MLPPLGAAGPRILRAGPETVMETTLYDFSARLNSGEMCPLSEFRGVLTGIPEYDGKQLALMEKT